MSIDLDRAIELIKEKRESDANKIIKTFAEDVDMQLLNGRWGPYLKIGKENYKLPKDSNVEALTYEECIHISENQPAGKKKFGAKKTVAEVKKPAAKKAPAKKPAAKKAAPKKK
jgi:DNA topoisomerase-1